jgi:hypothetical protein
MGRTKSNLESYFRIKIQQGEDSNVKINGHQKRKQKEAGQNRQGKKESQAGKEKRKIVYP